MLLISVTPSGMMISVVILNRKLLTHVEIVVEAIVIHIHEAQSLIHGGHFQRVEQMPLRFAEIVGATVQDDAVRHIVECIVPATDTLISGLQQVFMLIDHAETEHAIHGDDKLR